MLERLEHAFTRGLRSANLCAVLFADLDRFKAVNDTYGHQVGDALLVAVAERLLTVLRPADTLARMSGDEFVILCEDLNDPSQADAIAARVDAAFAAPFRLAGLELTVSTSIGIAFTGRGDDHGAPEDLIRDADLAMYQSKRRSAGQRERFDLRELHVAEDQAALRASPARGGGARRVSPGLPADRRLGRPADHRRRGAAPLAAPGPR